MQKLNTTHTRRSVVNILATSSAIATLPAFAASAQASDAIGPDHPDAELLRLGTLLEQVDRDWAAQYAIDRKESAIFEARVEQATGIAFADAPEVTDENMNSGYYAERHRICHETFDGPEHSDENNPWTSIHDRLYALVDAILPRKAVTTAGLAVQARAVVLAAAELWLGAPTSLRMSTRNCLSKQLAPVSELGRHRSQ